MQQDGQAWKEDDPSTPAKPSERIKGSSRNPKGSAGSASGGIKISEATNKALQNKVKNHNEKHGSAASKRVTLGMLKAVYRRGAGAFSTSHRPGVSRGAWAMARVNAFLTLVRRGRPANKKYISDNDLLPDGHPRKPRKKRSDAYRQDVITVDDITAISNEALPIQISRTLEPEVAALMAEFGAVEMGVIGASMSFNMFDPAIVGFITDFSAMKAVGITATTREQLARTLAEGIVRGEGIDVMSRNIRDKFGQMQLGRARTIARTEVNRAANAARTTAQNQSGMVEQRKWLSTRDRRTRDTHIMLNGQIRDINKPFRVPGTNHRAMYPGDFGVPSEDINCRCTTIPIVKRASRVRTNAADKTDLELQQDFDRLVDEWTERMRVAVIRGLVVQEEAVLAGLRRRNRAST